MLHRITIAILLASAAVPCFASTPPPQPAFGPAGSNYKYAAVSISGPLNDGPPCPGPACNHGLDYYIYQPSMPRPSSPIPVILFLHGYSADDPSLYGNWMEHMARKGFTVVWLNWDNNGASGGDQVVTNEQTAFGSAIARLKSDPSYVPPAVDSRGWIMAGLVGHSAGALTGFRLAALSWDKSNGIPPLRAIAAINPGQGALPDYDLSGIHSSTRAVIVVGSAETDCEKYVGAKIYDQISMVPADSKTFLEAWTDDHGSPGLDASHSFPVTLAPMYAVNDLDFEVSYKLSVALFQCAFYGANCPIALANGAPQTEMGTWSDNTPVKPLTHFTTDPQTTFPWPPDAGCTQ